MSSGGALSITVQQRDSDTVSMLLSFTFGRGTHVFSRNPRDRHVFKAVAAGDVEMTDLVPGAGGNVNTLNEDGTTPVMFAAQLGEAQMIRSLQARGARMDVLRVRASALFPSQMTPELTPMVSPTGMPVAVRQTPLNTMGGAL